MKIKADNNDYKLLHQTIDEWVRNGNISPEKAAELKATIQIPKTLGQQVAQYFFVIALSCILLAFGAIFIDDKFLEKLKQYFSLTNLFIAILFTLLFVTWFVLLKKKRQHISTLPYEIYTVIGSLLLVTAITYYCKEIGFGEKHSGFLAACSVCILLLSVWMRSYAMWVAGILAVMGWFGAFSTWLSNEDLFLGMNYPVRFALFGAIVTAFAWMQQRIQPLHFSHRITYITGLIILFTALWGVSVFGNYNSLEKWAAVRQTQVIVYAILFVVAGFATFLAGIKYRDNAARDVGIIALLANLYTRYFEYFWDNTNKGLFFLILAVSFWFIGKRLERWKTKQPAEAENATEIS
ncbi:hypothetical protein CAP35_10025 [Chitinophagaceae bacterium IBVUCB1]|nr:hypothetical protein CAP35_10025 [Chitinophagaceae bacterium IBVUCB1]